MLGKGRQVMPDSAAVASNARELTFIELVNVILRHWRLCIILPLALAFVAVLWSLTRERTYVASASFMPQSTDSRVGGGASSLAQQFGISLGADRPRESPQYFVDLLSSVSILRQAVESKYDVTLEDGRVEQVSLIDLFDVEPGRVPAWRKAVKELRNTLSVSVARETGVVRLAVSSQNPKLAEQIAQELLKLLNEFNLTARQHQAEEEGSFIDSRIEAAERQLLVAEAELQLFLTQNRGFANSPELQFQHDRLQRQVVMRQEVYTALLRSREQIRIDAHRDVPVITIIDHPGESAQPQGRGTVLRAGLALLIGLVAAVFLAFAIESATIASSLGRRDYSEFKRLLSEAWYDVRHPHRWRRRE